MQRGLKYTPIAMFVLFHSNIRLSINSLLFNQHWLYVNVSTNVSTERTASEKRFPKMKRGLAGMIYLSYICTRNSAKGELSSVGSERLPYKQRVGGSNPSVPTRLQPSRKMVFLCREHSSVGLERLLDKQEVSGSNPLVPTDEKSLSGFSGRLFCRSILIPVPL